MTDRRGIGNLIIPDRSELLLGNGPPNSFHSFRMKSQLVLLLSALLCSCVHTSLAPVANPQGLPVVIRVPGAKVGQKVDPERIAAIDRKVDREITGKNQPQIQDPAILDARTIGFVGDMKTKRGLKFVGYAPFILIRSTYPAELVDRAAGQAAAAFYRGAKKHYELIPVSELETKSPKPKQP